MNVEETVAPDLCAQLVAENIAWQIERRVSPRRAMGQAVERSLERGAQGIRCEIAGRIGGAEIARREKVGPEGRVPLHTLRADIDYGVTAARTAYGNIGIKVWIYKGEVWPAKKQEDRDVWQELEEASHSRDRTEPAESPAAATAAAPAVTEAVAEVVAEATTASDAVGPVAPEHQTDEATPAEAEVPDAAGGADEPETAASAGAVEEASSNVDA